MGQAYLGRRGPASAPSRARARRRGTATSPEPPSGQDLDPPVQAVTALGVVWRSDLGEDGVTFVFPQSSRHRWCNASCDTSVCPPRSPRGGQRGRHPGYSKPRISPRALPNSTLPAEGAASREERCRRARRSSSRSAFFLALLRLPAEDRLLTTALSALSKGERAVEGGKG